MITCPYCGERPQIEFRCGGEAHIERPTGGDGADEDQWAAYLYARRNTKGLFRERWYHQYGCRQWFHVERDTTTHEITAVYDITETRREELDR
ncbi:MAG: sarcosine oxidase subunit delta [Pseudomonadota bacterium]